jgi:hypothetical protein
LKCQKQHLEEGSFHQQSELKFKEHLLKFYIWSITLHGAEKLTLRKADNKHLKSFNMWCWRRIAKIIWIDRVKNEEI